MTKRIILLLILTVQAFIPELKAQKIGEWELYPSYMCATKCVGAGNDVYALADGNLFKYSTEDTSVKLYDCMNELNDVRIALIEYNTQAKRLLIIYDNGNIDIMDEQDNVVNINALKLKPLSNKTINNICMQDTYAYICMEFGFITLDMNECVIQDTYQIGLDTKGFTIKDGTAYIATDKSVYSCDAENNWHIASNWTLDTKHTSMRAEITSQGPEYVKAGDFYWHAEKRKGMVGYSYDGKAYAKAAGPIQPNSPVHDLFSRMEYVGNRLVVAGGINTVFAVYNDPTAMFYEDGTWSSLDFENADAPYPFTGYRNICNVTSVAQDPNDDSHHFASTYRTGLFEFRNGKLEKQYDSDNSPLKFFHPSSNYKYYTTCNCLKYDADGNLWMTNEGDDGTTGNDTIIRILRPNGEWTSLYYEDIARTSICEDLLFTSSGVNFMVSRRMDKKGFFGFDTRGTLENTSDDRYILRTTITNQDGTTYDLSEFYCMTEDLDGRVWCGTTGGLFVINNPQDYFDDDFRFEQVKIARNDGSGLADYLLNGVSIRCIAVDGANRKWIGTQGNGVYLVSADGQEMIHHFTAEDTPLLSNDVQCIAIHPITGMVMIGTDMGLCSYMGDATIPEEKLEEENILVYPNPVRPDYTGPITIKGLTMNSEVKICSTTGQLVWSGTSNGGTFVWNGCNKQGKRVSSGVYHIIASNAEGKKAVVSRLIVIR